MNKILLKGLSSVLFCLIILYLFASCQPEEVRRVERWGVFELTLKGPTDGNPYMDNTLDATFTNGKESLTVLGFYDGHSTYRVRFSPDKLGEWTYNTQSNVAELSNHTGTFTCVEPTGNNHGPVRIVNTYYLEYADGTPFYQVGTTAYQWTSVKQSVQDKTVETLKSAPFNKIRMCVFPKSYEYGNDTEPWAYPYSRTDTVNDFTQPNYAFFQNFDKRVQQLVEMGIQADVILFHPYDKWGYSEMGKEMNAKYVRYLMARLSAYRNVWWSLANEWDVPRIKDSIDWEGIGTMLQLEDVHQRLRSIHNWYHEDTHFYDHSRPWITHVSAQTYFFFKAKKWRDKYRKPVLFDEMRYEGDVPSSWGSLTAQEMTDYFWKAGLTGVYGMHGDTYKNDSDEETEVRWWAKGGTLMGQSAERIAFFKSLMEEAPVTEMTPELFSLSNIAEPDPIPDRGAGDLIDQLNRNIYTLSKEGSYYMAYVADSAQSIELNLTGTKEYSLEVIDTWNMKISPAEKVSPGKFLYQTKAPFTALRLISK